MARPRKAGSRGLPDNLYRIRNSKTGKAYYRYKRPDTGKWRGLGSDRKTAERAARKLNHHLTPAHSGSDALVARVLEDGTARLGALADRFKAHLREVTDDRGNTRAPTTLREYDRMIDAFVAHFGTTRHLDSLGRQAITAYLDPMPARTYQAHRSVLRQMFALHVATSDRADNPVEGTLNRVAKVERERLTKAEYDRIRDFAEPWFRNAMDLSLRTLQARHEVAAMRFDDEREPGKLFIDRQKVEKHEAGHICLTIGPQLRAVIARCRDDLASPFMVHKRPERTRREYIKKLDHWTQVRPEKLTREFKRLRDEAGIRADLPANKRPSFHEIRSLGGRLLEESGVSTAEIQRLYGHSTERMTKTYTDRRGRETRYIDAESP